MKLSISPIALLPNEGTSPTALLPNEGTSPPKFSLCLFFYEHIIFHCINNPRPCKVSILHYFIYIHMIYFLYIASGKQVGWYGTMDLALMFSVDK
jgi:hypothetical protein